MINKYYRLKNTRVFQTDFVDEKIKENDVVVRPYYLSICSSDLNYYFGRKQPHILHERLPLCLIHEAVGKVIYDPKGEYKKGSYVVLVPLVENKKNDNFKSNYQKNNKFASSTIDGFARDMVVIDRKRLIETDHVEPELSVFCEVSTIAYNAIKMTKEINKDMKKIAVWGAGNIGYVTAVFVKHFFPNCELTIINKSPNKLNYFPFADNVFTNDCIPNNMQFDCGFECVGGSSSESCIEQMIDFLRPQGIISLLGLTENDISINTRKILEKGIILIGNNRSNAKDFSEVINIFREDEKVKRRIPILMSDLVMIDNIDDMTKSFELDPNNDFKTVMKWNI